MLIAPRFYWNDMALGRRERSSMRTTGKPDTERQGSCRRMVRAAIGALAILCSSGLSAAAAELLLSTPQIQGEHLTIQFNRYLYSRVVARFDGKETILGSFVASETVVIGDRVWNEFSLVLQKKERVRDDLGAGERLTMLGKCGPLTKEVSVTIYDEFPSMAFFDVRYTNTGAAKLAVKGWTNNAYRVNALPSGTTPAFWSYQSGSYEKRPNWVVPLHAKFHQENFQGMNASDYGGGTPIVDVWRRDVGIAVGHVDPRPRMISLPVSMPDSGPRQYRRQIPACRKRWNPERACPHFAPSSRSTKGTTSAPWRTIGGS